MASVGKNACKAGRPDIMSKSAAFHRGNKEVSYRIFLLTSTHTLRVSVSLRMHESLLYILNIPTRYFIWPVKNIYVYENIL